MAFTETSEAFLSTMKTSPILATGLGLWGAAMLTFVTKDIPKKLLEYFKREFTTSVTVGIRERELVALTQWVSSHKLAKRPRSFHLRDQTIMAAEGAHFFFFEGRLCWFERPSLKTKDVVVNVGEQKNPSEIQFGYLGRSREFLINLFRVSTAWDPTKAANETHIFTPRWRDWNHVASQPKRDLRQLILPDSAVSELRGHLDWFFKSSDWFRSMGIPYRTGICLYGPPGTGKTSLVRAIAAQWDLSIYSVDFSNMDDSELKDLIWKIGPRALILIEDIDTLPGSQQREIANAVEDLKSKSRKTDVTLGGLLNAIDGVVDSDGRIFVMTTNHIEKLDPALLRPGRVNLSLKLDYMTPEMFRQAFKRFFPDFKIIESQMWKVDVSPALFQSLIFRNLNSPQEILNAVTPDATPEAQIEPISIPSNVYNFNQVSRSKESKNV